ncbi:MAG: hypothetical protein AAGI53_06230 [Planctomycetota bacterium]
MQTKTDRRGRFGRIMSGLTIAASMVLAGGGLPANASASTSTMVGMEEPLDELVLRNGRVVKGRITEETATEVKIVVVYAGIEAPTTYPLEDVLSIRRAAEAASETKPETATPRPTRRDADQRIEALSGDRAPSVFHVRVSGQLRTDIAVAPIRNALEAAGRADTDEFGAPTTPDYLILEIDRLWSNVIGQDIGDDVANFDEFSIAGDLINLIQKEMPRRWNRQPHVVVWVKNAMGGAAFVPFVGQTIVFHPEGRMGGIGNLGQMFEGVGDEVVRQKQRSLRLARAQGLAIEGGYDYRLVNAMAMMQYELSYRFNGGVAELLERTPENPGEFLLTENGTIGENVDSLRARVTGSGNDVLTLREDTARHLGVSAGTAETLDDVLDILGIYRDHRMLESRSDSIMENWSRGLKRAERDLPKMWREYNEVQVGGNYQETRRAIGQKIRILEDVKKLMNRFSGDQEFAALEPRAMGLPGVEQINILIEQHRVQLIQARP